MAGRVFINYRRRESRKEARHLATVLRARFGKDGVFLDESGIDGGANWLQTLERQVAGSTAMVALIGKDWADQTDEAGNCLIEQPNDFVRFEIAQALLRRIPLLPVLLDGAPMPRPAKLPDNLWPFTQFQAMPLRGESFEPDAAAIGQRLRQMMAAGGKRPAPVWTAGAGLAAALAMGVLAGPLTLAEFGLPLPGIPGETQALRRVAAAEQERDGLKSKLDAALAQARRQADDAEAAAKAASQRVLGAERSASEAVVERNAVSERLAAAERERDALRGTLGTAQTNAAAALRRATDADTKLAGLQKQFEALAAQQSRAAADLAAAQRERDDARSALASAIAKIADRQKPPPLLALPPSAAAARSGDQHGVADSAQKGPTAPAEEGAAGPAPAPGRDTSLDSAGREPKPTLLPTPNQVIKIFDNQKYSADLLKQGFPTNLIDCVSTCRENPSCVAFTFHNKYCEQFSSLGRLLREQGARSGIKEQR